MIAVVGLTGVGKSKFISYFSDTAVVGHDIESCKLVIQYFSSKRYWAIPNSLPRKMGPAQLEQAICTTRTFMVQ